MKVKKLILSTALLLALSLNAKTGVRKVNIAAAGDVTLAYHFDRVFNKVKSHKYFFSNVKKVF